MAQTTQVDETGGGTETPPVGGQSQGIFGNPTTILLLVVVLVFFFWSRRRRTAMEERLQAQRRERAEIAEQSAMSVAHIMRRPVTEESAAAAATEGLASAARMPEAPQTETRTDDAGDTPLGETPVENGVATADLTPTEESRARVMERAEAAAAAERVAEEQAAMAAQAAELGGESAERRMAAAEAAAEEARADTADARQAQDGAGALDQEREAADALRAAMRELDNEVEVPLGAVMGDGTTTCPVGFPVKGNASSRIYHEPGQVSYPPTVAEFCFASAEAAEAAGFRQSRARGQRAQE